MQHATTYVTPHERTVSPETVLTSIRRALGADMPASVRFAQPDHGPLDGACLHPVPRLMIALSGRVSFWHADREARDPNLFTRGMALATIPNGWMKKGDPSGARGTCLGFVFQTSFIRILLAEVGRESTVLRWWHHTAMPLPVAGGLALAALTETALMDSEARGETARALCRAILMLTADTIAHAPRHPQGKGAATFDLIANQARECFAEPLTRESMARQFRLHPNHLSRLFREHAGIGFSEFVTHTRIRAATEMIRAHPETTVAEVAKRCGYADAGYFIKVFRKVMGMTPVKYRSARHAKQAHPAS